MASTNSLHEVDSASYNQNKRILICIPAHNESKNVANIVHKASKYASEVIVYDDGSNDDTSEVARASGARVINSPVNRGYGADHQHPISHSERWKC